MKKILCITLLLTFCSLNARAQVSGNVVYENSGSQQGGSVTRRYPAYSTMTMEQVVTEQPNQLVTTFQLIDAKILTSVETKEYVAVFGLAQEADTVQSANKKLQAQVADFQRGLAALGVRPEDTYLDFITQNRVYEYTVKGTTAREKVSGFQVKENVAVRYKERAALDQIIPIAAQAGILDLIKVDYVVGDLNAVRAQMTQEALKVIKQKEEAYAKLGVKLTPVSVSSESFDSFQPSEAYNSYKAYEAGPVDENYRVIERRKNSTFYFEPLSPGKFDMVLAPAGIEPQVQCTYIMQVKYYVNSHTTVALPPPSSDRKP